MTQTYHELVTKLVSYKSISTDPAFQPEITNLVTWLSAELKSRGFTLTIFRGKTTNPVILASYTSHPTTLVYGHYDVQPAQKADGWTTDPFVLSNRAGRLWGRGVVDNKGQVAIHIATVFDLITANKLTHNVKFLIEGNEETANPDLIQLMLANKNLLKSDYILVSDGEIVGDTPTVETSLRGGFNLTLTYTTATTNVHSGLYGGAIPNAAYELTKLLSTLYDSSNVCTVPGFYDSVDPIAAPRTTLDSKPLLANVGVKQLLTEPGFDFFIQTGLRPTIQITGIKSGYIDSGYANIIPAEAEARLNFRLVCSQDPEAVFLKFKSWVQANTPPYVNWTLDYSGVHRPVKINTDSPMISTIKQLLKNAFGKEPITKNVGGAIPFVTDVKDHFDVDTLLVSLGNDDCNMHGANENFRLDLIDKGLSFSNNLFST